MYEAPSVIGTCINCIAPGSLSATLALIVLGAGMALTASVVNLCGPPWTDSRSNKALPEGTPTRQFVPEGKRCGHLFRLQMNEWPRGGRLQTNRSALSPAGVSLIALPCFSLRLSIQP